MKDLNKDILLDYDMGIGLNYMNLEERAKYTTWSKEAVKQKIKQNMISEEMRVLYVAMTRAKEKLIISGIQKDFKKQKEKLLVKNLFVYLKKKLKKLEQLIT